MAEKRKILIIRESNADQDSIFLALQESGYQTLPLPPGGNCLDFIAAAHTDIVLLDIMLPNDSSLEILQKIRRHYSRIQQPIIMVTGTSDSAPVIAALKAGANDYITRPIDTEVMLTRIQTQLQIRDLSNHMEHMIQLRTKELEEAHSHLQQVMAEKDSHLDLANQYDVTLKNVLETSKDTETSLKKELIAKITEDVLPFLSSAKRSANIDKTAIEHVENRLKDLIHSDTSVGTSIRGLLSYTEVRIASLVKEGFQAKEIAAELSIAVSTVNNHIARIRQKLGIKRQKTNLRKYLKDMG
jgi:DNA-binding NarL/FixJ family response regulator